MRITDLLTLFSGNARTNQPVALGRLESEVLEILWHQGEGSVREVRDSLSRHLAYTTVMTTLDRLFKKGLLSRQKVNRSFRYSLLISQPQRAQAPNNNVFPAIMEQLLPNAPVLVSYLLDGVDHYDEALLLELERKIAGRRRQFERKEKR